MPAPKEHTKANVQREEPQQLSHACGSARVRQEASGLEGVQGLGVEAWGEVSVPRSLLCSVCEVPVPRLLTVRQASHHLTSAQAELQSL